MKLSVIVATRNRAQAVVPCLNSITVAFARAAPLDAEIVIVDNGSTDETGEVVAGWASASGARVKFLVEPRSGKGRALNRAQRAAEGELLAHIDDDCRMHPEHVNDLLRHDATDTGLVLRGGGLSWATRRTCRLRSIRALRADSGALRIIPCGIRASLASSTAAT